MFGFFFALLGTALLASQHISHKANQYYAEQERLRGISDVNDKGVSIFDPVLYADVVKYADKKPSNNKEYYDKLLNNAIVSSGVAPNLFTTAFDKADMVQLAIMVQEGKLPTIECSRYSTRSGDVFWYERHKLMMWCQEQMGLRGYHKPLKFLAYLPNGKYERMDAKDIAPLTTGHYYWPVR